MKKSGKIYIAGHTGLVGAALFNALKKDGYGNLIYRTRSRLDLTNQAEVLSFFKKEKPEFVFLCAAKVGGILANDAMPAEFIYENLMIEANIIHSAYLTGVKKLLFFGSTCAYPKDSLQPMKEEYLFHGALEPTSEAYATAKIAGMKLCQFYRKQYGCNFISVIPATIFGPGDNFDADTSHVMSALIQKIHCAKEKNEKNIMLWGTGLPKREFIYVDDAVDAALFLMKNYNSAEVINAGTGVDVSIKNLARKISKIVGYKGNIKFDLSKPDGAGRKLLDSSRINALGWRPGALIDEAIEKTYYWYVRNKR